MLMAFFAVAAFADTARADDWMFRGSAYSHSPRWGQEVGPNRFARGPYYTPQYGGFVRSGYRHLNSNLGGWGGRGGGSWDHSSHFESWWQAGGQWSY